MIDRQTLNTTYSFAIAHQYTALLTLTDRNMPLIKDVFHPASYTSLAVGHTGKIRRLRMQIMRSQDCAHVLRNLQIAHTLRNLQIAHTCYAISRLRTHVTQSPDCTHVMQSPDCAHVLRNLQIACSISGF